MICYGSGTFRLHICRVRGAALFATFLQALFVGFLGWLFKLLQSKAPDGEDFFPRIISSMAAYAAFNIVFFLLLTHRTVASYERWVKGADWSQDFTNHVLSAGSLLFAYSHGRKVMCCAPGTCKHVKCSDEVIEKYHNTWLRLLSLLHAVGIAKLHGRRAAPLPLEVIDMEGLDASTVKSFWEEGTNQVELVMNWTQSSAVRSIGDGVIVVGPPIASLVWVQLCEAYGSYMAALRIVEVPYPFPYVQLAEVLLFIHCILTPLVFCKFSYEPIWNGVFCFLIAWLLLTVNKIASRLQEPYGLSADALDLDVMQEDINMRLLMLARPSTRAVPVLSSIAKNVTSSKAQAASAKSFVLVGTKAETGCDMYCWPTAQESSESSARPPVRHAH